MKKIVFLFAFLFTGSLFAQNLQLHYDFLRAKNDSSAYFTSTLEYLGFDDHGSTYLFIDMDYSGKQDGVKLLYWEVSRDQKIGEFPIQLHVEFTAGNVVSQGMGFGISRSYIAGFSYPFSIGKFNFMGAILYRQFEYTSKPNYQFTGVWAGDLLDGKLTMSGFIDIWTEEVMGTSARTVKVLTEPQFWYNFNDKVSFGGEVEISRNFIVIDNKTYAMPTLAVKYNL